MTRREMMDCILSVTALPGGVTFLVNLTDYKPKFFSSEDFEALQAFTEILIPTDETPGAREANCAQYIDFVLSESSEVPITQTRWRDAMQAIRKTGFHTATPARRLELVTEMSLSETDPNSQHPAHVAYQLIKQQTAFAFYTSRQGTIDTLNYKGSSYNAVFPACTHPEHQRL
jgi:hypothetical protein